MPSTAPRCSPGRGWLTGDDGTRTPTADSPPRARVLVFLTMICGG